MKTLAGIMFEALNYLWSIIEFTAGAINLFVYIVNLCFTCSAYVGKFIVDVVSLVVTYANTIVSTVFSGIVVMCEDFLYFLSDIENILLFVESQCTFFYESVLSAVKSVYGMWMNLIYTLTYTIVSVKDTICTMYRSGLRTVYDCIITFKGAIILIGNVIWMSLTLIPGVFVYSISIFVYFINRCAEEIISIFGALINAVQSTTSDIFDFIIDTPFEAVCGLIIGFCLIYIVKKYKRVILNVATQNLSKMFKYVQESFSEGFISILCMLYFSFNNVKNIAINTKHLVIEAYSRRILKVQNSLDFSCNGNERLCVVCKDSETNVVIIPCKHMCLCEICSQNAAFRPYTGASCPVCRCEIREVIKVYL